jgi:DNA-binding beta-propeller fold protein YncE
MAANVSVGTGAGPVPDILQGTDTQDMATPDFQGVIGIGEWCTTATYEFTGEAPWPGVVHCGSAHLWQDAPTTNTGQALEEHRDSGVTSANGFTLRPGDLVACGNGHRGIGGRFDGATTTHNLWNNNHFTFVGDPIGPNGTATGNPPGSVISQPRRECLTFSTNLHGQTFQWIKRTPPVNQSIIGSTNTLFAGDVTHVMTNPGGTVGWVTMEAGQVGNTGQTAAPGAPGNIHGHLAFFDPNNPPAQVTNFLDLGTHFPHGNWVCADGIHDTVPSPLDNHIGVVRIPTTPSGAGAVVAFFPSVGTYPVATGTMPNCAKAYTSNAVDHRISVTDAMTATPITFVDLGSCSTCTLMGAPVPTVHVPIQITPTPDNSKVVVQGSKSSLLTIIDTATDTVFAQMDCANGCHGSYMGPKLGGGLYLRRSGPSRPTCRAC